MEKLDKNTQLISWGYLICVISFFGGIYFIRSGYISAFVALFPGLAFAPYLLYRGEFRYGIVLLALSFSWFLIYVSFYPYKLF